MGGVLPLLLAAPALLASVVAVPGWGWAVAAIVLFGVPHGALDVEIGRTLLHRRLPRGWFPVFGGPYLALVGLVMLAWRIAPELSLAGFLILSVWHFGAEEAGGSGLAAWARGGLPIAMPVLARPDATARVLSAIAGVPMEAPPGWLMISSVLWLLVAAVWAAGQDRRVLALPAVLCAAFAVLPPLTAFAAYFIGVHAPAHTAALIRKRTRAPRVRDLAAAWRLAVPTTLLTIGIGAALWPFATGVGEVRLVNLTFQMLAAFTVPHVLLETWLDRRDQPAARATRRRADRVRASAVPVIASGAQWRWNARSSTSGASPGS